MIRLVLWLCAGLVGVLWWANHLEPNATAATATVAEPAPEAAPRIRLQERPAKTAAARVAPPAPSFDVTLPEGVTLTPVSLVDAQPGLMQISHRDAPAGHVPAHAGPTPQGEAVVITGNRVNLRAGPGTSNAVVGTLTRNMRATVIDRTANGWVELHAPAVGLYGFMAAKFVAPAG
ncbi:hypothetical protein ACMU_04900 [Actibacterium mucosum KCTC 23349]|uniref:SH3b domain-containing protein n=1 Tax=Actibacterium mucosum KCTC 23349 TaxID=1454373 RepID=A0A037ZCU7_9RHOB|nr:SH3 domain-containing protein [Actibacterium mucosum]KAJ53952.1 hypothetical protein ACMU_04900 [Actibacterium mucosum KCTC 23349]